MILYSILSDEKLYPSASISPDALSVIGTLAGLIVGAGIVLIAQSMSR